METNTQDETKAMPDEGLAVEVFRELNMCSDESLEVETLHASHSLPEEASYSSYGCGLFEYLFDQDREEEKEFEVINHGQDKTRAVEDEISDGMIGIVSSKGENSIHHQLAGVMNQVVSNKKIDKCLVNDIKIKQSSGTKQVSSTSIKLGHQASLSSALKDAKVGYYRGLLRAAVVNANHESRKRELELKSVELNSLCGDEAMDIMSMYIDLDGSSFEMSVGEDVTEATEETEEKDDDEEDFIDYLTRTLLGVRQDVGRSIARFTTGSVSSMATPSTTF